MNLLVIDNYDSFTYNLVHSLEKHTDKVTVWRNDAFDVADLALFDKILLSPGPGIPSEANLLMPVIEAYAGKKSIFGVCLGQQAIASFFGGKLVNTQQVHHGVESTVALDTSDPLFCGLPMHIQVGRYHSWVVDHDTFPSVLSISATGPEGEIMALRHNTLDVCGVQFHPESILTPHGDRIIKNWLKG